MSLIGVLDSAKESIFAYCLMLFAISVSGNVWAAASVMAVCKDDDPAANVSASCLAMVSIPAGTFRMGGYASDHEQPTHDVHIKGFKMGAYEITQRQWRHVMGSNPSRKHRGSSLPVGYVTWDEVQLFIETLNQQTGLKFRLPSEAEWEYAALAGFEARTHPSWAWPYGNSTPNADAWWFQNSDFESHPVGQKKASAYGLYDMLGNVAEWTEDCWHENYHDAPSNGEAWMEGSCDMHVVRGGSWSSRIASLLPGSRDFNSRKYRGYGFRIVLDEKIIHENL